MSQVPAPTVIWHSRTLLIAVGALGAVAAILTFVGLAGFPVNAPVEQVYAIGVIIDMAAVAITLTIVSIVEYRRRADPARLALPVSAKLSVFAIIAAGFAVVTTVAWVVGGGPEQLLHLIQGLRARYMYHTGGLFVAGIPWVLSLVFGALGFRPGGHRVTNILALVAVGISGLLAVIATVAAIVYGLDLSD